MAPLLPFPCSFKKKPDALPNLDGSLSAIMKEDINGMKTIHK
jgi:hypothetical protein